jgi:hypothetical protein
MSSIDGELDGELRLKSRVTAPSLFVDAGVARLMLQAFGQALITRPNTSFLMYLVV